MGQKTRGHRQTLAQRIQRLIATIGQHGIGLGIKRIGLIAARTAPPNHGQAIGQRRANLGQQPGKPACKQRLGTGQFANSRRFDQQTANQTPQRQRRHIARPAMHQQIGATGTHRAALGRGLKAVQHRRVGKILGHKAAQLRSAKGLEKSVEPQPHHIAVIAADQGQPGLSLLTVWVISVEQARNSPVNGVNDLRHRHVAQMLVGRSTHMLSQRLHLGGSEHGNGHFQPNIVTLKRQHLPLHIFIFEAGQITSLNALHLHARCGCHALAALTNSSTASEQPLAAAPSARPSSKKPLVSSAPAHRPTSSVRMVVMAL